MDPLGAILSSRSQPKNQDNPRLSVFDLTHTSHANSAYLRFSLPVRIRLLVSVGSRIPRTTNSGDRGARVATNGRYHTGFSFRVRRDGARRPPQRKRYFRRARTPTTSTRRPTSLSFGRLVYGVRLRSGTRSFGPFLFLTRYGCTDPAKCVGCCISSP
jgi:hypothetical protein